ncbi:MAG: hypothetical protein FIB05_01790 [Betaproteobacteria bacterium]|nr:hypothetical protein [Betaproteobacteria bacterium]
MRALRPFALALMIAASCAGGDGPPAPKAGEVDASFADGGLFAIDVDIVPGAAHWGSSAEFVATDATGKVWATGGFEVGVAFAANSTKIPVPVSRTHAVVARLMPDGRKDAAFGASGYLVDSPQGFQSQSGVEVAPLADGGALLAEVAHGWDSFFPQLVPSGRAVRLGSRGVVDGSYGNGGAGVVGFERFMQAFVDAAGDVIFLGERRRETAQESFGYMELRRFDARGDEDAQFLHRGRASLDCSLLPHQTVAWARAALQADGKLLVAQVIGATADAPQRLCVSRLNPDGNLDTSYGSGGRVQIREWGLPRIAYLSGFSVAGDGRATLVLTVDRQDTLPLAGYIILSLTSLGEVDPSRYAGGGAGPWDHAVGWVLASAVQADGKILVAGYRSDFSGEFRLERLGVDGKPDQGFGPGGTGIRSLDLPGWHLEPRYLHLADGAIFVAGRAVPLNGGADGTDRARFAVLKLVGDPIP